MPATGLYAGITLHLPVPESLSRSEEHTSELQSQSNLVCRLLLEKKKKQKIKITVLTKIIYAPIINFYKDDKYIHNRDSYFVTIYSINTEGINAHTYTLALMLSV